ncbi:MAG: hypothetical protein ACPGN3_13155 [Opitutales bacterium]
MRVGTRWWVVTLLGILSVVLAVFQVFKEMSTNVLDLLPAEDEAPEIQFLQLLSREQKINGLQTIIRPNPDYTGEAPKDLEAVTESFVAALDGNPAFTENYQVDDPAAYEPMGEYLFENRMDLLFPAWIQAKHSDWLEAGRPRDFETFAAAQTVEDMSAFLDQVEAFAFEDLLVADPLLLIPSLLTQIQDNGRSDASENVLMWIETGHSPLAAEGQGPVVDGIYEAFAEAVGEHPEAYEILFSGVSKFAYANRMGIVSEVSRLNTLGILGVIVIALVFMRPVRTVLAVMPLIVLALAFGLWTAYFVFDQLHAITLIIGSILAGVVIDYGFHLVLSAKDERKIVMKPLILSAISTAVGFAVLSVAPLPLLRQVGVFVCAGVIGAISAGVYLFRSGRTEAIRPSWAEREVSIPTLVSRSLMGVVVAVGVGVLVWHPPMFVDDIQSFSVHFPELVEEDLEIRRTFGRKDDTNLIFALGDDAQSAVTLAKDSLDNSGASNYGSWVPLLTSHQDAEFVDEWLPESGFLEAMDSEMREAGFNVGMFEPFKEAFGKYLEKGSEARADDLSKAYLGLSDYMLPHLRLLYQAGDGYAWVAQPMPPEFHVKNAPEGLFELNQVENLNQVLGRYREWVMRMGAFIFAGIAVTVYLAIGRRSALRVLGLCLVSLFLSIAWQMAIVESLSILSLIGLLLGFCLCLDYALFSQHAADHCANFPYSILVSALTTGMSFGVLSMSTIPAVASLGSSVFITVILAIILVYLNFHDCRNEAEKLRDSQ